MLQHLLLLVSCDLHADGRCTDLLTGTPFACRVKLQSSIWGCTALSSTQDIGHQAELYQLCRRMLTIELCDCQSGLHVSSTADLGSRGVMQMPLPPSVQSHR